MNIGIMGPSGYADMQREARLLALLGGGAYVPNCYLDFSIGSSSLTVRLLTASGQAPSAANPIVTAFHDAAAANGKPVIRRVTQPLRLVIPSTATMGFSSSTAGALWFVLFDDVTTRTQRLGVINCLSGTDIYPLGAWPIASSTATPASAAHTFYSDVAVASMPFVILGRASWESGLSTAGTWDALPTRVLMYGPGRKLPGDAIAQWSTVTGAEAHGTTTIPNDDTKPQITEGNEFMTLAYDPVSAANIYDLTAQACVAVSGGVMFTALFRAGAADALAWAGITPAANDILTTIPISARGLMGSTASTTFSLRAGSSNAATMTFNGVSSARKFGGAANSFMIVREILT